MFPTIYFIHIRSCLHQFRRGAECPRIGVGKTESSGIRGQPQQQKICGNRIKGTEISIHCQFCHQFRRCRRLAVNQSWHGTHIIIGMVINIYNI